MYMKCYITRDRATVLRHVKFELLMCMIKYQKSNLFSEYFVVLSS